MTTRTVKKIEKRWRVLADWLILLPAAIAIVVAVVLRWQAVMDGISVLYDQTGLAMLVLIPLSVALVAAIITAWVGNDWHGVTIGKIFEITAVLGPMTGFLGTTLGLMTAIDSLGQARSLDKLLEMVGHTFKGMGIAFSTTVWGLVLAIIAIFVMHIRPERVSVTEANNPFDEHREDHKPAQNPVLDR